MAAVLTGTPVALAWGNAPNPDPISITVPADATAVYLFYAFDGIGSAGATITSATLNGNSPSEQSHLAHGASFAPATGVCAWYNPTAGTQNIDVEWTAGPGEGPVSIVCFVKDGNTTTWRDVDHAQGTGSTAVSVTLTTQSGDLVLKFDQKFGVLPSLTSGWTSEQTQSNQQSEYARLSSISATSTSQVCDSEDEDYSTIVAIAIPAATGGTTITPGSGGLTVSGTAPDVTNTTPQPITPSAGAVTLTGFVPGVYNPTRQVPAVIAGEATGTSIAAAADPWSINVPNASAGDLLLFLIDWDDSTAVASVAAPSGQNGETISSIAGPVASASTEMRMQAWYTVCTGSWTSGTISFNPDAAETATATVIRVPAGTFDATTPIGASNTSASAGTAETNVNSPTFTAGATDGFGRLVIFYGSDADAITAPASGTTTVRSQTAGGIGHLVVTRNTAVSNSESVAAITATIASDSWASLAFVVRSPPADYRVEPGVASLLVSGTAPDVTSGGANVSITPASGSVSLTGFAPTYTGATVVVTPASGSLAVTGAAPTVTGSQSPTITPASGSVVLTGSAPVQTLTLPAPAAAAIVLTGFAPTITVGAGQSITPGAGSVVLTGFAPSAGQSYTVTPGAGSVSLSGSAPTVDRTANFEITPAAGGIVVTGAAPTVTATANQVVTPDAGVVTLGGHAPTLQIIGNFVATPDSAQIVVSGFAPDVTNSGDRRNQGAGTNRRRKRYERKYTVEIDGQDFIVGSAAEAEELLAKAQETAKELLVDVRVAATKGEKVKAPKAPRIRVKGAGPDLSELVSLVSETRQAIKDLYSLARTAEIAYLMKRIEDDDEDDAITALLLH